MLVYLLELHVIYYYYFIIIIVHTRICQHFRIRCDPQFSSASERPLYYDPSVIGILKKKKKKNITNGRCSTVVDVSHHSRPISGTCD